MIGGSDGAGLGEGLSDEDDSLIGSGCRITLFLSTRFLDEPPVLILATCRVRVEAPRLVEEVDEGDMMMMKKLR